MLIMQFQSTLPQGERRASGTGGAVSADFNPRSHKGSDSICPALPLMIRKFQSTLPQGERQEQTRSPRFPNGRFQSTLPQGERLLGCRIEDLIEKISIHAPTRGATGQYLWSQPALKFQSTLPQGERHLDSVQR